MVGVNQRAQIRMTDAEIAEFVEHSRTTTLATNGPTGRPHLVARSATTGPTRPINGRWSTR